MALERVLRRFFPAGVGMPAPCSFGGLVAPFSRVVVFRLAIALPQTAFALRFATVTLPSPIPNGLELNKGKRRQYSTK